MLFNWHLLLHGMGAPWNDYFLETVWFWKVSIKGQKCVFRWQQQLLTFVILICPLHVSMGPKDNTFKLWAQKVERAYVLKDPPPLLFIPLSSSHSRPPFFGVCVCLLNLCEALWFHCFHVDVCYKCNYKIYWIYISTNEQVLLSSASIFRNQMSHVEWHDL